MKKYFNKDKVTDFLITFFVAVTVAYAAANIWLGIALQVLVLLYGLREYCRGFDKGLEFAKDEINAIVDGITQTLKDIRDGNS